MSKELQSAKEPQSAEVVEGAAVSEGAEVVEGAAVSASAVRGLSVLPLFPSLPYFSTPFSTLPFLHQPQPYHLCLSSPLFYKIFSFERKIIIIRGERLRNEAG